MNKVPHILLAEDNPHDAELTLTALESHNLVNQVVTVTDGAEALDYLYCRGRFSGRDNGHPVVALLDLKMPKVDGIEVLRAIKQDPAMQSIPVVMLTSSREEQDLIRSYQLGVNAYVVKPVDFQAFVDAVKQLAVFWVIHNQRPNSTPPQPPR
jgi:CheY-like chemotaxis protein